ncbi:E3 ubiquitin-protein ligase listerin [Malania oleifera]|uniref:E3 ubiquitin-protein ligase listerin n=1 Tax=Malania oleifera TaxID=397392 RepID=UPI0025ADFE2E|nr:E3 ubiquitin-protein ligase listerin [Malania oleifera]
MGRQKGDGGRSKTRPSSSSLAASLLPSGTTSVGFGGYVGSSRLDSSLAIEDAVPLTDIDSELAQHLKRLARKDPTTKLKALTSLSMLLKQKSGKDIVPIIPIWAFEYKRLLLDYSREVRRATHDTMTNLVITVGRDLAPHLKSLMGPWWFSQFDPVSEVSQAAKQSLQAAFPAPEKRLDALILCTNEIFLYLEENLKLTPQSISDKAAALDELEEMHQQVISSSLLALATLLDILVCMQLEGPGFEKIAAESKHASKARATTISSTEKLFSSHKYFLDFLKSQSPTVRSASYSLLRSLIKNVPHAFNEGNIRTIAAAILGAFQEKDPACHSAMWDAILLFSKRFPGSWTSLNVQKTILSRLWHFLKSGCFGSQQVSYAQLIVFLDTVPPDAVVGEKFFLEFFQNLWAGRNLSVPLHADRLAFFMAFKECFIWGLRNASRYCNGVETIHHFQVTLIDSILVNALWHDYLLPPSSKRQETVCSGKSGDPSEESVEPLHRKTMETLNSKYSMIYLTELGKCVTEILSGIYPLDHNLLFTFCATFKENCLAICQQLENTERCSENVERIINFLLLVDQHAVQKGETWPFIRLVGPMLSKSFPLIRLHARPDAVRLLSVSISIFGPRKIIQEIFVHDEGHPSSSFDHNDQELGQKHFLQVFGNVFVPWCLCGNNCSTSARLDLLLGLLDDDCFTEQWCIIMSYATNLKQFGVGPGSLEASHMDLFAMLMEKAREEIRMRNVEGGSNCRRGSHPDHWHHEFLDSTAVSVICSHSSIRNSDAQFVRAVLGGSTESDQTSFLSKNAVILVFEEVFKKFINFIKYSPFSWVGDASSLLNSGANNYLPGCESNSNMLEMARFALKVLDGSFFCLKMIDKENDLVPGILAAIFVIDWESRMASTLIDALCDESTSEISSRLDFGESVHAFCCKISKHFWKSLSMQSRERIGHILIQFIRSVVFRMDKQDTDKITSLCSLWMLEVLEFLCQDQQEEQKLLDQFIREDELWPLWVIPDFTNEQRLATLKLDPTSIDIHASVNYKFVALIDKLISKIGFDRVVAGCVTCSPSAPKEATNEPVSSRAWLAAEILCTWKWKGGCALSSFLPSLSAYARTIKFSLKNCLLDSIVSILLDGALVHGSSDGWSSVNVWAASHDELGGIEEPFLRAFVSLLLTLFEDHIWERDKAMMLFELLVKKLSFGETVNWNCLRILPPIMKVLIQPLCQKSSEYGESSKDAPSDSFVENLMHVTIQDWLQKALSLPPLISWQPEQHMEEWYHLVISCYPLNAKGGKEALKVARDISPAEQVHLFELFQKQRHAAGASAAANQLPSVQILLSKLMAVTVGYCCKEFNEKDWEFILSQLRRWIEAVVVTMEEVAENINDTFLSTSIYDNSEVLLDKLDKSVLILDPVPINIARHSLFVFSLFCRFVELHQSEVAYNMNERWEPLKDRVFEAILRIFFSTGVAEAIARSYCREASSFIASSRLDHPHFWELVASSVINSSTRARDRAVKSFEFWGLSKGSIGSLYAILFSSKPVHSLQFAAYVILSTEPVSSSAIVREDTESCSSGNGDPDTIRFDSPLEGNAHIREEISCMIEKLPCEILETDIIAQVNLFLAWALLLSHISYLPPLSPEKERLVQYIQDSANSTILDCLFQQIPLELCMVHALKKKDVELPAGLLEAAKAATHAIKTGSLLFSVESLWPIGPEKMASLSAAIFGLMLRVLPAYVRGWFGDLRDRSASSMIESFTKSWCSPPLIADELSQIKKVSFSEENFSVSVSKSANEVVATYTKDETGMDLVIRLPASYPLRPVDVDCTRSLGISEVKQRKWLMSMMAFVRNQNGALAEAIRIWKSNFDKEFEGVEECPICYSVIHTANHSLPRLACKTCKHKFHSACLYKWFSTSHKSTCPLCQSPF